MTNTFKIQLTSSKLPASFTAFDILYYDDHVVKDLPLMQRKKLLAKTIKENERIAISRYIEELGIEFYKIAKQNQLEGIVLGQYSGKKLLYKTHVSLGISTTDFQLIKSIPTISTQPFNDLPSGNDDVVWIEPSLVCTVKYMLKTANGSLRQPLFKGLRDDKNPKDCTKN